MKKVLLVTLWGYDNFGNRLQAIALKQMLEKNGYLVECVPNQKSRPKKGIIKEELKCFLGRIGFSKYRLLYFRRTRYRSLKKSSLKMLYPVTEMINDFRVNGIVSPEKYYAAIVGSDQVWHKWTECKNELDFFYLSFMPKEKRFSYAASFGFEEFPLKDKITHINGLNGMNMISCREKKGCTLVEEFTSKKAELVLDPTLCVGIDFWNNIEQEPVFRIKNKYIFVMLLGKKDSYYSIIAEYAKKNNYEIFDLTDRHTIEPWRITISNFLWLVHHAQIVFTDSFHCSVFSILYERAVTIFHRREQGFEHMFDRIATLLDLCGLQQCEFNGEINDSIPDYSAVKERLKPMIEKSNVWLSSALSKNTSE